ncbi:SirB2 family protein [Acidihalobacter ferrooxydans]|uniref:Regulator SirB n=1 Tax=Acidihalobacter ferrooxydans TaxID=1765967 RepID=A0A1P8UCY3_9GAMM|nr:SirB2 family protein [Acidihalobacter ferrooxydans]APZ41708.1 regulator SirB [Acidihalobacter ferrooxydans]
MFWLLKLHVASALLSISGFALRGIWMLRGSSLLQARATRVLPHIVDTFLLASGVGLVFTLHLYPTQQPWLAAKLVGLVFYIVLGMIALKRGRTRGIRAGAWVAAIAVFFYILAVAATKQVVPLS